MFQKKDCILSSQGCHFSLKHPRNAVLIVDTYCFNHPQEALIVNKWDIWFPGGGGGGGGGGGHSGTEGDRSRVTYFAEEGVFFKTSACPRFSKKKGTFLYPGTKYGCQNPLTIHEIYAVLTPSHSASDSLSDWAYEFAAAKHAEDYKI